MDWCITSKQTAIPINEPSLFSNITISNKHISDTNIAIVKNVFSVLLNKYYLLI